MYTFLTYVKKKTERSKNQTKAIYKYSRYFLVIENCSCSSNVENYLWTFLKKDRSSVKE